ncbi:hypothetical protein CPB83DRAFT_853888 [Crepidotus variabilis]|uniref:choline-phosphate cytidylyltransferase n=1 Tax=Crepidotus variabilis TaxID=179855 RepID=A0A9P6JQ61_9AGAR|nr:hypothetical protein CPB83DRAFT_853888 [Crepidotus variabilis]
MSVDAARTRTLHSKRSFGKYPKMVDSPAYDASEEDNDPLTDDAQSAVSVPISNSNISRKEGSHPSRSSHLKHASPASRNAAKHHFANNDLLSDSDGVDSPTYDGDVESSTTAGADTVTSHKASHHYHHHHQNSTSSISTLGTSSNIPAPASITIQSPSAGSTPAATEVTTNPIGSPNMRLTNPESNQPVFISPPAHSTAPLIVRDQIVQEPPVPAPAKEAFNPAALTQEDIQAFVAKAIQGEPGRTYKINQPPTDRPIRVYADGVYDLFHFAHALQLRQAKLSFPSVYLLVGVNSDDQVWEHKARTIMTHAERLEAVRHCRWVDEVVSEAPWVIDEAFVKKYEIDYVAHDEDLYASAGHDDVYHYIKSQGKFIPTRRTPGVSTSELLERIVSGYRNRDFDEKLTKMGHAELRAEGSDYDGSSRYASRRGSRSASPVDKNHLEP